MQTRYLSGWGREDTFFFEPCPPEMLEVAKANLREHFAVVGVTKRFDETMMLLKRAFGWGTPLYLRRNIGKKRPKVESYSQRVLDTITRFNQLDLELYELANEMMEAQVRDAGPAFQLRVRAFTLMNRVFQKDAVRMPAWRVKAFLERFVTQE
jgi:hypothetical protein